MKTPSLPIRIRILPVLCAAAALLFAVKVANVGFAIGAPTAQAESRPVDAEAAKPEAPKPEKGKAKADPVTEAKPPVGGARPKPGPAALGGADADMLQVLSERRAELDRRADETQQREVLLKATEQRINEKIAQLETMQRSIATTVKQREEEDDGRFKNLVRIYETMKPKEAARIFEQLDQPVLIAVVGRMKEPKVAPILASMDPAKAKALTVALADRKPAPAPK
jgi:flagellar motility protein MotE (MotC chaperone)